MVRVQALVESLHFYDNGTYGAESSKKLLQEASIIKLSKQVWDK